MSTGAAHDVRSVSAMFPCYNDAPTIGGLVDQVYAALTPLVPTVEVIVVNDGSSDASRAVLDSMALERPWLRVVHHEQNRGYGQALISGFSAARHDWIFYTDGDAQYDAREAAVLVPLATCDSRRRPGLQDRARRPVVPQGDRARVPPRRQAHVRPQGPRHRLRLPAVPSPPVHRRPVHVDERGDLRRDDVPVPARRGAVRRGPGAPLLPSARALAVLPAAGDRPQRAAVAHAVVAVGDPWTLSHAPTLPAAQVGASWVARVESDSAARWTMWVAWPIGVLIVMVIGRNQWFARDDWAFIFTRERLHETARARRDAARAAGRALDDVADPRLPRAAQPRRHAARISRTCSCCGRPMSASWCSPTCWMRRFGVTAWISTLMTILLLVFGAGWENLVFAVQIVYNFSLLAFLGQLLLVDHDGPLDRRDGFGVLVSLIGVSSSGFGPFFGFGVGLLLVLRRRWLAAVVAVVPQALAWIWWWLTWGADPAGGDGTASLRFVVNWVEHGLWAVFGSLSGTGLLAWPAIVLCVAMAAWSGTGAYRRAPIIAMLATVLVMYAGIGTRREVFGVFASAWPRYQYMAAMIVAPMLAFGLDQIKRFASWARWIPRAVLLLAIARNIVWMHDGADTGSAQSSRRPAAVLARRRFRRTGSRCPRDRSMSTFSPDVLVIDLDTLVDDGAITRVSRRRRRRRRAAVAGRARTQRLAVTPAIDRVASASASTKRSQSASSIAADIAM